MGIEVITDAVAEPISLELAWAHLLLDADGSPPSTPHDTWLEQIGIPAARRMAERFAGRAYAEKTLRLSLDAFPTNAIELAYPDVQSIESITYVDTSEVTQTLDASMYSLDATTMPGWVTPAYGEVWPETLDTPNAVKVTFVVGPATVDADIKAAILLALGHLFVNREAVNEKMMKQIELGFERLLWPDRVGLGV